MDGSKQVRLELGLDEGDIKVAPKQIPSGQKLFVQSTSGNRKIKEGTEVLFQVEAGELPKTEVVLSFVCINEEMPIAYCPVCRKGHDADYGSYSTPKTFMCCSDCDRGFFFCLHHESVIEEDPGAGKDCSEVTTKQAVEDWIGSPLTLDEDQGGEFRRVAVIMCTEDLPDEDFAQSPEDYAHIKGEGNFLFPKVHVRHDTPVMALNRYWGDSDRPFKGFCPQCDWRGLYYYGAD